MFTRLTFLFLLTSSTLAWGGRSWFEGRYESAHPTAEARQKALDQVRKHKDEVVIRDDLDRKLPTFHKRLEKKVTTGETFCQNCHLPLPHSKKLRSRAFLNMHSRYIACATCHFRPEGVRFDYRWLDYASWRPVRPDHPFRTGLDIDNSIPIDGNLKIAPFFSGEPAIPPKDGPFAEKILQRWREGTPAQRAGLKARLHAPLEEEGPECVACHTSDRPMLDLQALGAEAEQVDLIQFHRIPSFFSRYRGDDEKLKIIGILR